MLENFTPLEQLQELRRQATTLVDKFDPESISIFSTKNQVQITTALKCCWLDLHCSSQSTAVQSKTSNAYFSESANNISFFFEEHAFDVQGQLRQPKALSINKMGHGAHPCCWTPVSIGFGLMCTSQDA